MSGIAANPNVYLAFSAVMFCFGIITMLSRKNAIALLMGVELMLNAAALNFVVFQAFRKSVVQLHGHVFSLFIIVIAALEAAIAFAIVIRLFAARRDINPDHLTGLKG